MYGTNLMAAGGTGASLASAGLVVGSIALFILGGIFIIVGIVVLLKKNSVNRP